MDSLKFGVEIELLLGGRNKTFASWRAIAGEVSKRLKAAGVPNHVSEDSAHEAYHEWAIVREVTVPNQPAKGLWGIELVSPVYCVAQPPASRSWPADLAAIFTTLHAASLVPVASPHCSTHIHISSSSSSAAASALPALARAALYFERALDALAPPARRASWSYWCRSNRASPALAGLSLRRCLARLQGAGAGAGAGACGADQPDVVRVVNLFPAASAYGRAHGRTADFVRGKVYKWNFAGVGSPRSVEYRQAPGCGTAEEAEGWVRLVLAFVAGAVRAWDQGAVVLDAGDDDDDDGDDDDDEGGSLEELWGVVGDGARVLGWEGVGAAAGVFARREP